MIAKVVVDLKISSDDDSFEYNIPEYLKDYVYIGSRVLVSFGMQDVLGYVIQINEESEFSGNLKDIKEVYDYDKELTDEQVNLAFTLSKDLNVPIVSTLDLMRPTFLKEQKRKYIFVNDFDFLNPELALLFKGKSRIQIDNNILRYKNLIKKEIDKGNIQIEYDYSSYGKNKKVKFYYVIDTNLQKTSIRNQIISLLQNGVSKEEDIRSITGVTNILLNKMVKEKIIGFDEKLVINDINNNVTLKNKYNFNIDQEQILGMYDELNNKPFLLFSNDEEFKAALYLKIIMDNIKQNKKTIIFAPNIMMCEEFSLYIASSFEVITVYSYHSKNKTSDNYDIFMNVIYNKYHVLVTTNLGLFLPYSNIGTIIVLDEDSRTYINENYPNYDLREVVQIRTKELNNKLIFASSTPSINLFYQTRINKFYLLEYNVDKNNEVIVVDMKNENIDNNSFVLSKVLIDKMKQVYDDSKISMLIVNNKAYSTQIKCRSCGEVLKCPKCHIPLTYYNNKKIAKCSYCDYKVENFSTCKCGSSNYMTLGFGLEQVHQKVGMLFPKARIIQVDSDNVVGINDYLNVINAIEENEVDIILGTNFLTKSLKYDNIKLVGLLNVDSFLNLNDHRAAEFTYNMIAKMANKEISIIQTYYKDHYAVNLGTKSNYDSYYLKEISLRESLNYDPFFEVNKILAKGPFDQTYHFAYYLRKALKHIVGDGILGPTYDYQTKGVKLIIKHNNYETVKKVINDATKTFKDKGVLVSYERYPKGM